MDLQVMLMGPVPMEIDRIESKGKNKGKGKGKSKDSSAQKRKIKGKTKRKKMAKAKERHMIRKVPKEIRMTSQKARERMSPSLATCVVKPGILLGIAGKLHRSEMLLQSRCQVQQLCKVLQVHHLEVFQAHRSISLELSNCQ